MIVAASVIIAILRDEPDAAAMSEALEGAPVCRISAVTDVETTILTDSNRNPVLSRRFDDLLRDGGIQIESVTAGQAEIARAAYRDFGKGRHKTGLNFWDCFAYALAKEMNEPLLFKGQDFAHTDVERADI